MGKHTLPRVGMIVSVIILPSKIINTLNRNIMIFTII